MSKEKNLLKITWKTEILSIIFVVVSFVASIYFYLNFPDKVPVHWNIYGNPDNWASKEFGAFFFPALILIMYVGLIFTPYLDPKREQYKNFADIYNIFRTIMTGFMTVIYFLTGFAGIGYNVQIGVWVPVLIGMLFIVIGNYMGKIKSNWMFGNKNMWTLSSEEVWNKSNRMGGKALIVGGLLMALDGLVNDYMWKTIIFVIAILVIILVPNIYSYIIFNQEKNKTK